MFGESEKRCFIGLPKLLGMKYEDVQSWHHHFGPPSLMEQGSGFDEPSSSSFVANIG